MARRSAPPRAAERLSDQRPTGRIAFKHEPEGRRIDCDAWTFKPQRDYPLIGLTPDEILAGLRREEVPGIDIGGVELVGDDILESFFSGVPARSRLRAFSA